MLLNVIPPLDVTAAHDIVSLFDVIAPLDALLSEAKDLNHAIAEPVSRSRSLKQEV